MSELRSRALSAAAAVLVGLVGPVAATALITGVPREESGRTVEASIGPGGDLRLRHVAGRQFLSAYLDIAGVPTACDGITRGVRPGQRFTEEQCARLLIDELVIHARGVMACTPGLRGPGRDWPRFAAVSLAYNVGVGAYCRSTVRARFNAGDLAGGCDAILAWDKARVNGRLRAVRGLTLRRERERAACLKGV